MPRSSACYDRPRFAPEPTLRPRMMDTSNNPANRRMRSLILAWLLALGLVWAACGDDDGTVEPPPPNGNEVDLAVFEGCWHIRSGSSVFGPPGPCRTSLDSVVDLMTIAGGESLFAAIDTVTHLGFVEPYYGRGDYTGTTVSGRLGAVLAEYRDAAGACTLVTHFDGDLTADGDSAFTASYIVQIEFAGDTLCTDTGGCTGFVTFTGRRRADARCTP